MTDRRRGRKVVVLLLAAALAVGPGCTWQKIPPPPPQEKPATIPIIVGIELADSPTTQNYGSTVIKTLKEQNMFQYTIWPYNPKTPVDGVLRLSIDGSWSESKAATVTKSILVGLSLGLLGPFIGPKTKGVHHVTASLASADSIVVSYDYEVTSEVSRGVGASKDQTMFQANRLQTNKIVAVLTDHLDKDRARILRAAGSSSKP